MIRKGSDILLSIEEQNQEILGYLRSMDLLFKRILNRLNLQDAAIPTLPAVQLHHPTVEPSDPLSVSLTHNQAASLEAPGSSKIRAVRQQVVYSVDEKPVPIAKVKIYNSQGELIKETRTGPSGKWSADLNVGQSYGVTIEKSKVRKYPLVKLKSEFSVQTGSEPQILERLEVS